MNILTRDQVRATHAYQCVKGVVPNLWDDYETALLGLGTQLLRSGLAATMAQLERMSNKDVRGLIFDHLGRAGIPGLDDEGNEATETIPERVRGLQLESYILATREMLRVLHWLKRAAQARAAR